MRSYLLPILFGLICCSSCINHQVDSREDFAKSLQENRPLALSCDLAETVVGLSEFDWQAEHCLSIEMLPEDFAMMRTESRFGPDTELEDGAVTLAVAYQYMRSCDVPFPSEFNWYDGQLWVDQKAVGEVSLRKRGFIGSIFSPAPSLKIKSAGLNQSLVLSNNAQDATRLIQVLKHYVYEKANYPAPKVKLANVQLNDSLMGVYSVLEPIESSFLKRVFNNNTGILYEGQIVDFVADWFPRWEMKSGFEGDSENPILKLSKVLEETDDDQLLEELESLIDIDQFIRYWALDILLDNKDSYTTNRNNFFVYFNPAQSDKAVFIPWGLNEFNLKSAEDLSNKTQSIDWRKYQSSDLSRRLSRVVESREMLVEELRRLIEEVWQEEDLMHLIEDRAEWLEDNQIDPNFQETILQLKNWVKERRTLMLELLDSEMPNGDRKSERPC